MKTACSIVNRSGRWLAVLGVALAGMVLTAPALAHELHPAYLQLKQINADSYAVLWKVPTGRTGQRLALQLKFPDATEVPSSPGSTFTGDAFLDRFVIRRPGGLAGEAITIDGLAATATDVLVRIEQLDELTQVARLTPGQPTLVIEAAPDSTQVMWTYLILGVEHILIGIDHLLFVLALLLIVKGWRKLVGTITAFTVAHSLTLGAASLGWVLVPGPPVEAIIALSIVFVAVEILHVRQGRPSLTAAQPWVVAFSFGLLHGFGFAGALAEIGLPPNAIPLSLLFFNLGVELGQLIFVGAVLAVIGLARRFKLPLPERLGWLPPYAIGSVAMFWVIERVWGFL